MTLKSFSVLILPSNSPHLFHNDKRIVTHPIFAMISWLQNLQKLLELMRSDCLITADMNLRVLSTLKRILTYGMDLIFEGVCG